MCSGAMMHARLRRVVFGAADPKTGAAGSVTDLFAQPLLNHQTQVHGGVLAQECGALLSAVLHGSPARRPPRRNPLRDDAVRTPEERFADLPGYPWAATLRQRPAGPGRAAHALSGRRADGCAPDLALPARQPGVELPLSQDDPGVPGRWAIACVAPDMIGFGKSDKPKKDAAHSFSWHRQVLLEFIERLDLTEVVLVVQDWGGQPPGLHSPMAAPSASAGLLVMNTALAPATRPTSGLLAWREMCAKKPEFDVAKPARPRQPANERRRNARPTTRRSPTVATAPHCAPSRPWCPTGCRRRGRLAPGPRILGRPMVGTKPHGNRHPGPGAGRAGDAVRRQPSAAAPSRR